MSVGKNLPHDSSKGHVTGHSVFIDDRPFNQDEVLVSYVPSPVASGLLKKIHKDSLSHLPDVHVFTHEDLAHNLWGSIIIDQPLLVEKEISFVGEALAVIAAKNYDDLMQARKDLQIDIEEKEPILSIDDAIAKESFIGPIRKIKTGDIEKGFENSDHIIEDVFTSDGQEQFYLESQACIAYPLENDHIEIHSSTQHPTEVQHVTAKLLGLDYNKINCIVKRMGGGFGGKESQASAFAAKAALVARKLGCAARLILTKDDDMVSTGKRHPFKTFYKVGFDKEGLIQSYQVKLYSDGGAFADLSTSVMERAMLHSDNAYYLPNAEITGTICKTNFHPHTAFRGFGGPQGVAVIENVLEEIAMTVGKDPYEIRRLNSYQGERCKTPYGQIIEHNPLPEMFDQLADKSEFQKRYQEIVEFNKTSQTTLRGLSMSAVKFGISFTTSFLNQGSALVSVMTDGSVQVSSGGTEMGQGLNTKLRQVVATEFGLAPEKIDVLPTATEKNANTSPTAASSGADLNCAAAKIACGKIKNRLACVAIAHFNGVSAEDAFDQKYDPSEISFVDGIVSQEEKRISFTELVRMAYYGRVALQEHGFFKIPDIHFDREAGKGTPFFYYTNGVCASEVEIDRFTGDLKVQRVDLLMDLGKMINSGIDRGQTIGAFVQGMGWVTTEKLIYDDKGFLTSHSPTTYKIPNIQDTPRIFNVDFIKNPNNPLNVCGSKAVGEPPLLLGISVWTAVKQALSSVDGIGIPRFNLPATAEEILMTIENET